MESDSMQPTEPSRDQKIERLVCAAIREFARAGPDGARVDSIATAAGMNKRLLYHYVGDKEAMFRTALAASVDHLCGRSFGRQSPVTDTQAWQVVSHGLAAGAEPDLEHLASALGRSDSSADRIVVRVALAVFGSLMPAFADRLTGNAAGEHGRQHMLAELDERIGLALAAARDPKPRIRLKPELSRQGPRPEVVHPAGD